MEQLYTAFVEQRRVAGGDQSAGHHAGRPGARPRRQDRHRRQRARSGAPTSASLRDDSAEEPSEAAARRANLTFIKLDGNVGCVVNGAGLAMATMDLVKYYGGEPANFLDIGGSSSPEKVVNALKIITADPQREGDPLQHLRRHHPDRRRRQRHRRRHAASSRSSVPIVIRLTGTNEAEAIRILEGVGMHGAERHGRGGAAGGRAGAGGRMSIFVDGDTRLVVQGITGREGSFHARQMLEYGTAGRGRRDAGQGRPDVRGQGPGLQHRGRGGARRPAPTPRSSTCRPWPPPRRHLRGRRCRHRRSSSASPRASRCMHMSPRHAVRPGPRRAAHRPQLSRPHHAGRGPRSASSPATSARRAGWGSCPGAARSPTRS